MYTALSGQLGNFRQLEVVANNLANANTTGFKAERLIFEKVLNDQPDPQSGPLKSDIDDPNTLRTDEFVRVVGSYTDLTQGPIQKTSNPLDAAIEGEGMFVVQTPLGERYTRAGNFTLDAQGRLVTQSGHPILGSGGEITISGTEISISGSGDIRVDGETVGTLRVVSIPKDQLRREAGQLFIAESGAPVTEVTNPRIQGGAIEGSNVNAVRELTDMILASRLYESFSNVRESSSRMNELRNTQVGRAQG